MFSTLSTNESFIKAELQSGSYSIGHWQGHSHSALSKREQSKQRRSLTEQGQKA